MPRAANLETGDQISWVEIVSSGVHLAHDPNGDDLGQVMNDVGHFERAGVVHVESTEEKMEN